MQSQPSASSSPDPKKTDPAFTQLEISEGEDLDQAISQLTAAIKREPKNAFFYAKRGSAYLQKAMFKEALRDYQLAIKHDKALSNNEPTVTKCERVYINIGIILENLDKPLQALLNYLVAFRISSQDGLILNHIKRILYLHNNKKDFFSSVSTRELKDFSPLLIRAITLLPEEDKHIFLTMFVDKNSALGNLSLTIAPRHAKNNSSQYEEKKDLPALFLELAKTYFQQRQFEAAIQACTVVLENEPKHPKAYLLRGRARYQLSLQNSGLELKAQILEDFEKAQENGSKKAVCPYYFALSFLERAMSSSNQVAITYYLSAAYPFIQEALELDPMYLPAHVLLAKYYELTNDYPKALDTFLAAIPLDPSNSNLISELIGFLKSIRSKPDIIATRLNQIKSINLSAIKPSDLIILGNQLLEFGYLYKEDKQADCYDIAISCFTQVIGIFRAIPQLYTLRAYALAHKENYQLALADLIRSIQIDRTNQPVCNLFITILVNQSKNKDFWNMLQNDKFINKENLFNTILLLPIEKRIKVLEHCSNQQTAIAQYFSASFFSFEKNYQKEIKKKLAELEQQAKVDHPSSASAPAPVISKEIKPEKEKGKEKESEEKTPKKSLLATLSSMVSHLSFNDSVPTQAITQQVREEKEKEKEKETENTHEQRTSEQLLNTSSFFSLPDFLRTPLRMPELQDEKNDDTFNQSGIGNKDL